MGQRRLCDQALVRRVRDHPAGQRVPVRSRRKTEIDALPDASWPTGADAAGQSTIEAYTVMHDRDGEPETMFAAVLLADGRRAWGSSSDPALPP